MEFVQISALDALRLIRNVFMIFTVAGFAFRFGWLVWDENFVPFVKRLFSKLKREKP